ncbi:MAG TPA: tetratricopeptide repeat protein, partial [Phycisphaerae bacterium]|nr:tetratricopeptide repeat protein [Phycisphaerae bacterium]
MDSSSLWFDDDDVLVRELLRGRRTSETPSIPGYSELRELRRGGQGVVFLGKQLSTRRTVAIKLVLDGALASREARRRFEREIELVATLRHPNIVRVYDSGQTEDGRLYYIMEYIEGAGLDELISAVPSARIAGNGSSAADVLLRAPLAPAVGDGASPAPLMDFSERFHSASDVLVMFAKICDGVQHAHQQGVIHRDLKPSNVRIDREGEPHVLDFGLAKAADASVEATQFSRAGNFMGSLPWASPEQAEGSHLQVDVRSDVYSLGVILFQLLTGEFPYRIDGTLRESLQIIQDSAPRSPRELRPEISDEVATIALKCLAKESDRRYQSAGELARDIRRYLAGEPIEAKRDSAWYSVRKSLDRYRTAVRAGSVLLIALLLFSAGMVWLRGRAVTAERLAAQRLNDLEVAHRAEVAGRKALEVQVGHTRQVRDFLDKTLRAVDPWKHPGRDLGPLRELLDSAVARLKGAFPNQPAVEAAIAGTLGWDYRELGLFDSAETLLRRAYELSQEAAGAEHVDTLAALTQLATLMTERGRHEEAEALFRELHAIQERTLGAEHPDTLVTLNNLALDIDWQGRSSEAEALYRKALEAQTRLLGPGHQDRLHTLNNLAACLPALGKMDEALGLQHELIEEWMAVVGVDDPETLQARMNLATLLIQAGRLAEAEDLLRDLVGTFETVLTPKHPLTILAMHNLASVVSSRGRHDEGLALARRAFDAQVAFAGSEHPTTLNRKNELACSLMELKQWDEAIPLARELHEQSVRTLGSGDWRTLNTAGNLAFALNQTGKTDEAEAIWNQVIAEADPDKEATLGFVATARANLAALRADQG